MTMHTETAPMEIQTFTFSREVEIAAPIEITFESVLAELGPENEMPGGKAFPMKIEARPGGRWLRDLGNDSGHLWGHVQVIKPPTLLEICGPLFISFPATNHVQYRLSSQGNAGTKLRFDRAHFQALAESALLFEYVYYILTPDYNFYMDVQQRINIALFERFAAEGIEFAYPTQTVLVSRAAP
jgi:small-conductance mechanosensitive channel